MQVYSANIRQCRTVWEKLTIVIAAQNTEELKAAIKYGDLYEIMDDMSLEWSEITSELKHPGIMCEDGDIYTIDEDINIELVVEKNAAGSLDIRIIPGIASTMVQEIESCIDNDTITLVKAVGLFTITDDYLLDEYYRLIALA